MTTWQKYKLGDLVTFQRGHDLTVNNIVQGEYPVAGSNGPIGYHNKFTTKGPGLTIGRSGNSIGVAHYYEKDFWAHNTTLYSKEFFNCHPKFLYYLLKTLNLGSHNSGSAVPSLNRNYINPYEVCVPDITTQSKIAFILSSLDDKIELNRCINQTLEQIAQALYNQYFINNIDPENLPEGWETGQLKDIVELIKFPISVANKNVYHYYLPIDCLPQKSMALTDFDDISNANSSLLEFHKNDILFGAMRAYFHKVIIAPFEGLTRSTCFVIRPKNSTYLSYAYLKLYQDETISYSNQVSQGSTIPYAVWQNGMELMPCLIPSEDAMDDFHRLIIPLIKKIEVSFFENKSLAKTRDTLLPKLMSGEIDASNLNEEKLKDNYASENILNA